MDNTLRGSDLLETFKQLEIDTRIVKNFTIDAWCDNDDTIDFLSWMHFHLSKDNILSIHENEQYRNSCQEYPNKLLLQGLHYNSALSELQSTYPGILNYEQNLEDIQDLEYKIEMLLERQTCLEKFINLNENVCEDLAYKKFKALEQNTAGQLEKINMQNQCLNLGKTLDDSRHKLLHEISRYARLINSFECETFPTFLSKIPTEKYDQSINNVESTLQIVLNRTNFEAQAEPFIKTPLYEYKSSDEYNNLREKLLKTKENALLDRIENEKLKCTVTFLENLSLNKLVSYSTDNDCIISLEARKLSKESRLKYLISLVKSNLTQSINDLINGPQTKETMNTIDKSRKYLETITALDKKFDKLLSLQVIIKLLFEKENSSIGETNNFLKDIYTYISNSLPACQVRLEKITKTIDEHQIFKNLPMENKFKIFPLMQTIISQDEVSSDDENPFKIIQDFYEECINKELRVFQSDTIQFSQISVKMKNEILILKKFLFNGMTKEINIIPHEIVLRINTIEDILKRNQETLQEVLQMKTNAMKKIKQDKWFCLRRRLWIMFIQEPENVIKAIDMLKEAVKEKRKRAV